MRDDSAICSWPEIMLISITGNQIQYLKMILVIRRKCFA